jgi:hypothetical protein
MPETAHARGCDLRFEAQYSFKKREMTVGRDASLHLMPEQARHYAEDRSGSASGSFTDTALSHDPGKDRNTGTE